MALTLNVFLYSQSVYESHFIHRVYSLPVVSINDLLYNRRTELKEVRVQYSTNKEYEKLAKQLKLMSDLRVS